MGVLVTHIFPILGVDNLDDGIEFYTDNLGLVLDWRSDNNACVLGNGMVSLILDVDSNVGPASVALSVENADLVLQEWADRGVEIVTPIETQPWGMREFTAVDTFGNRLVVGHLDENVSRASVYGAH